MNQIDYDAARLSLAEATLARDPDLAQAIDEFTKDHGQTAMINDCMTESAAIIARHMPPLGDTEGRR